MRPARGVATAPPAPSGGAARRHPGPGRRFGAVIGSMVAAALTVAAGAGLAACGPPHLGLSNGSVSACYRAIPAADAAVHDPSAHLVGVHRISLDKAEARLPRVVQAARDNDTAVCAVVLHGRFAPGQVTLAPSQAHGAYAVLLITSRHLTLLAATVVDHVPPGFGRRLT